MKSQRPTEDKTVTHVSLWEVFATVGITCLALIEHIQYAEHSDDWTALEEAARTLDTQLSIQAFACGEYEHLFKIAMIELPPNIVGIRVKNPLYNPDAEPSSSDEDKEGSGWYGDIPF